MKTILKLLCGFIVLITLTPKNNSLKAQDLNIYETINYINSKLKNNPGSYSSSQIKEKEYKFSWSSDGYITIRETTKSEYSGYGDLGNNIIKAKGSSLRLNYVQVKTYNIIYKY